VRGVISLDDDCQIKKGKTIRVHLPLESGWMDRLVVRILTDGARTHACVRVRRDNVDIITLHAHCKMSFGLFPREYPVARNAELKRVCKSPVARPAHIPETHQTVDLHHDTTPHLQRVC
jgi:hypothetical protein